MTPHAKKSRPSHRRSARVQLKLVRPDGVVKGADASGPEPHPQPQPGSSVRSGLLQQVESFTAIARDLPLLFERHWQELGTHKDQIPLDPDWDRYFLLAQTGTLRVRTARVDGVLAGYIFNLVGPGLHYRSTLHAEIEMFWLDPVYRGMGVVGMNHWFVMDWFRDNDEDLRALGVKRISVAVKNGYRDGRVAVVFKRLGYLPVETVLSRML
jgi:hypothetical protein